MTDNIESKEWMRGIRNRVELARQWQDAWTNHEALANKFRYVRVQGDGFSAISISRENPCGRLIGKDGNQISPLHPSVREAVQHATEALPVEHPLDFRPGDGKKEKREHRIQAFLIHHALSNNKSMRRAFSGFEDDFDDLWFVTDELPAGEHRADIIAIGRKADMYFPVFIELKVERLLTELIRQLEGIRNAMKLVQDDFIEYLSASSGISSEKINFDRHRLMLVWPAPDGSERPEVKAFRQEKNGITACYAEESQGYSFTRWPKA